MKMLLWWCDDKKNLYKQVKTVSIVNETAIGIYESLGRENVGFLLESYDKDNGSLLRILTGRESY